MPEEVAIIMFKIISLLSTLTGRLAQAAILGTLGVVSFEVISRYIFNSPTQSSLEITEYLIVAMAFLPLAAIHRSKGHVSVEILTSLMPVNLRSICNLLVLIITFGFALIVSIFGYNLTYHAFASDTVSSSLFAFPMWIAYIAIPLGFTALALEALKDLVQHFTTGESV